MARPTTHEFVLGKLFVHVFSSSLPKLVSRRNPDRSGRFLRQVWPITERFIVWPPATMTDAEADHFATDYFERVEAVGRGNRT